MGERLVITEDGPMRPGFCSGGSRRKAASPMGGIAAAEHGQLAAVLEKRRQGVEEQVETLLRGEPADHAEEQGVRIGVEGEALLQPGVAIVRRLRPSSERRLVTPAW